MMHCLNPLRCCERTQHSDVVQYIWMLTWILMNVYINCRYLAVMHLCVHLFVSFRSISRGGQVWAPEGSTAFKCLLSARFCAALLSNISDCDETFNYWEPVSTATTF